MAKGLFPRAWVKKSFYFQARISFVRVKYLFLTWLTVLVGSWVLYVQYSAYTELCRGRQCKNAICDKYKRGIIDGSACSSLCDKDTFYMSRCLSTFPNNQVYTGSWGDREGIIRCRLGKVTHDELGEEPEPQREAPAFDTPTRGTSVEKFREMVFNHVKSKLGDQANLGSLVSVILSVADGNKDGKVSLPEARSMWALLQIDEVLLGLLLQERGHTPRLLGYCGDLYMTERVPHGPLYGLSVPQPSVSWLPGGFRRATDRWLAPSWPRKAKISMGLLELVEDIFHGTYGSFFICDMAAARFGYTDGHELRLTDARALVPESQFRQGMRALSCRTDEDCVYGADCRTACDAVRRRCGEEPLRPNLAKVCGALKDYLLHGAPGALREELERHLYACMALKGNAVQLNMEHSLLLNNLKSLLWRQISHTKDS
ncbi:divergent protein kinase domain 1A isoform X1 [Corythoichthys intestinalis]|uniref:divergent protein kinase domain 1A isoform X1 n=1 Tax=Corythoichthys intestinalis TaxID=161448 RepID=UPI0025A56162|nr:divergent protein kinase domain 1A isoform X1 [Corythoichthys intestinalis]XP_061795631.1 divergent protein kinase domain 1A-like isoform X2 [Nerophis lumbriciformis]